MKATPNEDWAKRRRQSNAKIPKLRKIEGYRNIVFNPGKDTLRLYTMSETCESYYREAEEVEFNLGSENLDGSRKQVLCGKLEQIVTKLDSSHAAVIQIVKSDFATESLTSLSEKKNYIQNQLKKYQQSAENES